MGNRGIGVGPADPPQLELPMADVDPVVDHRDLGAGARRRPRAVAPRDPRVGRRRTDLAKAPGRGVLRVALVRAGQGLKVRGPGGERRNPDGRGRIGIDGRGDRQRPGEGLRQCRSRRLLLRNRPQAAPGRLPRRIMPPAPSFLPSVPACSSPALVCPASDASYPRSGSADASGPPGRQRGRNRFGLARHGPGRSGSCGRSGR